MTQRKRRHTTAKQEDRQPTRRPQPQPQPQPTTYRYKDYDPYCGPQSPLSVHNWRLSSGNPSSKNSNLTNGYIQTWTRVPKAACDYINDILEGYNKDERHLFKHILSSSSNWTNSKKRYVPVSRRLMDAKLPEADPLKMIEGGILERDDYYIKGAKSYEYRIPSLIRNRYNELVLENLQGPYVNLFTSKLTVRSAKSTTKDPSGAQYPLLIRQAMRAIKHGYFNKSAVLSHLHELKTESRRLRHEAELKLARHGENSQPYKSAAAVYEAALSRFTNDLTCFLALQNGAEVEFGSIYRYRPAYRPTTTGRISHIGGGTQSCSREMKAAVYHGLPNVHNYDIKSSQAVILKEFFTEADIDCPWLEHYLANPDAKHTYAEFVGISVDTWKSCLYSLFMGAGLRRRKSKSTGGEGFAIWDSIYEEVGERTDEIFGRFVELVGPLYECLRRWHKFIIVSGQIKPASTGHFKTGHLSGLP